MRAIESRRLTVSETAELLGVSHTTIRKWIHRGHPVAGKLIAIPVSEGNLRTSYRIRHDHLTEFEDRLIKASEPATPTSARSNADDNSKFVNW